MKIKSLKFKAMYLILILDEFVNGGWLKSTRIFTQRITRNNDKYIFI